MYIFVSDTEYKRICWTVHNKDTATKKGNLIKIMFK